MCFSATASFTAAGIMAGIGTVAIRNNTSPRHRMVAMVPLLFAIQQAAEGVVWLTLGQPAAELQFSVAVRVFLAFALVVWPTWLPVALLLIEENVKRRRLMRALVALGLAVSVYGASVILFWLPAAHIANHSISYDYPQIGNRAIQMGYVLLYVLPAVGPLFVSKMSMARLIGGTLLFSLAATLVIKRDTLTSVWCFFAAGISGLILLGTTHRERMALSTVRVT